MSAHFTNLCSEDFWVFLDIDRDIFSQRISKIEVNKKCWWFDIVFKNWNLENSPYLPGVRLRAVPPFRRSPSRKSKKKIGEKKKLMVALRGTLGATSHILDRLSYRTPTTHRCYSEGFSGALTAIFFHNFFLDSRYGLRLKGGTAGSQTWAALSVESSFWWRLNHFFFLSAPSSKLLNFSLKFTYSTP